jgi:hypothetical protein
MTECKLKREGFLPWPVGSQPYPNLYWDGAYEVYHPAWSELRIIILAQLSSQELKEIDFRGAWWREAPLIGDKDGS